MIPASVTHSKLERRESDCGAGRDVSHYQRVTVCLADPAGLVPGICAHPPRWFCATRSFFSRVLVTFSVVRGEEYFIVLHQLIDNKEL